VVRGGRESVDHAPLAHDDLANAALGAVVLCVRPASTVEVGFCKIQFRSAWAATDQHENFWSKVEGRA
jgi:hypothetical protein